MIECGVVRLQPFFWRFWASTVLANLGDGIRVAAFPLLAAALSDDPFMIAVVSAASGLPWLLSGLWAGALADRHSARVLIASADVFRGVVLGTLVVLLVTDAADIASVAIAAVLLGIGETVRDTTAQTVVPRLVPTQLIERANGRLVAGEVIGNEFVGPLVGGVLFTVGAAVPFAANSAALVFAVLLLISVPASLLSLPPKTERLAPSERTVRSSLRWLARQSTLRTLVLVGALVALADSAWFAVFVLYAENRLGLAAAGFGALLALGAIGGLAGAWLAERLIGQQRHSVVLVGSIVLTALTPALLLATPSLWAACVVTILTSAGFGIFNVAVGSLRHRLTPARLLGRVIAASRTVVLGAGAIGSVAGGAAAAALGLDAPFIVAAALGLVALALWSLRPPDAAHAP